MKLKFSKYQGTGNDFILLDNLNSKYNQLSVSHIQFLCDRKFGIGADGLIKISKAENLAFEMDYFNSDGSKSFCGNGARCAVSFAKTLGINANHVIFTAIDGLHEAQIKEDLVSLKMNNVLEIKEIGNDFEVFTGSPHYVRFIENSLELNVFYEGRKIRYSPGYQEEGINVNFIEELNVDEISVATYERGVENETLSCGTGVTASALAFAQKNELFGKQEINIHTKGGKLKVVFNRISDDEYFDIYLIGPAVHVFNGEIEIK